MDVGLRTPDSGVRTSDFALRTLAGVFFDALVFFSFILISQNEYSCQAAS
jgi:hypothetical protein